MAIGPNDYIPWRSGAMHDGEAALLILGVGIDLVEVARFRELLERRGDRFVERVFTATERQEAGEGPLRVSRLAARWAAKEATAKALGSGLRGGKWKDIELVRDSLGAPRIKLHGGYARLAAEKGISALHVSISHTESFAAAQVVVEGLP